MFDLSRDCIHQLVVCVFTAPHMDPAVVAAHPMPQSQQSLVRPSSTQTPDSSSLQQTGFASANYGEQSSTYGDQKSLKTDMASVAPASHGAKVDQVIYSQASQTSVTQDFSSSGFSQSNISHSLQTDNLFSGGTAEAGILGKGPSDSGTISHKQYDIPPQLPMPPGHDQSNSQVRTNTCTSTLDGNIMYKVLFNSH